MVKEKKSVIAWEWCWEGTGKRKFGEYKEIWGINKYIHYPDCVKVHIYQIVLFQYVQLIVCQLYINHIWKQFLLMILDKLS